MAKINYQVLTMEEASKLDVLLGIDLEEVVNSSDDEWEDIDIEELMNELSA